MVGGIIKSVILQPFSLKDSTKTEIVAYTSTKNMKLVFGSDNAKQERLFKISKTHHADGIDMNSDCRHVFNNTNSSMLNLIMSNNPYKQILGFDSFKELTSNRITILNTSWRNQSYVRKACGEMLAGAILLGGSQALLINCIEIYVRYPTSDAHHEYFSSNIESHQSLPTLGNRYKKIRVTKKSSAPMTHLRGNVTGSSRTNFRLTTNCLLERTPIMPS